MSPEAYRDALAALGMSQARLARILGAQHSTTNRWATGLRAVPTSVALLLQAWAAHPELIPED